MVFNCTQHIKVVAFLQRIWLCFKTATFALGIHVYSSVFMPSAAINQLLSTGAWKQ